MEMERTTLEMEISSAPATDSQLICSDVAGKWTLICQLLNTFLDTVHASSNISWKSALKHFIACLKCILH